METNQRTAGAVRVTLIGSVVNLILSVTKLIAGIVGHSQAMIADAVHSLSDLGTDVVVIFGVIIGSRPRDPTHRYGHGKFETLATTVVGIALIAVGAGIFLSGALEIWRAVRGLPIPRPTLFPLVMAGVSIVSKEALTRYTLRAAKRLDSQAVSANAWHHRSDALSSVGAGLGIAGAIFLGDAWHVLDPIAAIIVSFFVLKVGVDITRRAAGELMEASLDSSTQSRVLDIVRSTPGVREPHNLKTRAIGTTVAVDIHIRVEPTLTVIEGHAIATEVESRLREAFGAEMHLSVHVEPDTGAPT